MDKVTKYLVCSYLYYIEYADTPLEDYEFDALCKELYNEFDSIEHKYKYLLEKDALQAGTGYQIADHHYPPAIKVLAHAQ
jgi:hypothetical protein